MILIADSGATKTAWRLLSGEGSIVQVVSSGLSPYYQSETEIADSIVRELLPLLGKHRPSFVSEVHHIYFYGTGCATPERQAIVHQALQQHFSQAHIEVHPDLLGAARALCGHQPGIACILGTGSNAALYNGSHIEGSAASLGFWLGDEGSGGHLGKQLVTDYLNGDLPAELRAHFEHRYPDRYPQIMERVYRQVFPNRYLASFSKFVFDHLSHPYCYGLAYHAFALFFEKRVQKLNPERAYPVHFTGSVAFYYANVLRQAAADKGYRIGYIAEEPAAGLVLYHQNKD